MVICIAIFTFLGADAYAQLSISYPANRTVLQRDKNNSATVYIRGTYSTPIERVEVQLRAINGGNTSGWMNIQNNPQGGSYAGQVDWSGGWYEMEVRGWRGDQIVGSSTVSRFGIGEVFMIAGQSNSQGYQNYGGPGAIDDRVNTVNYYNVSSNNELPQPSFDHLNADSYISPRGNSAWAYGKLGDRLAERLGVPILFYNAGWYGSAVRNWRQSINGTAYSVYNGEAFTPSGMPYNNLRLTLQYYVPVTGIRAILWHQGEADNFTNTTSDSYTADLRAVIEQTRNESGRNISWVVSRASFENQRGTDFAIIKAQNDVVASTSNTFYGPETDKIQTPRPDGAHFQDVGLHQLGEAWSGALNDDFFARSEPSKAVSLPTVRVVCGSGNSLSLTVEGGNFSSINWNNGQNSPNINVGGGRYVAKVRDQAGNILFSPAVEVPGQVRPSVPTIEVEGGRNNICQGSSLALTASADGFLRWNTGQTDRRINVNSPDNYSVTASNAYGCEATSAPVAIGVFSTPPPPKPSIKILGTTVFCAGGVVTLESNSAVQSTWSDGQNGATISVGNSGEFRVRAVDGNGCKSPESDPVTVKVNPLPSRPSVAVSGITTFCEGGSVTLTSNYENGNRWNTNTSDRSVVINQSGDYTVSITDGNGCTATSSPVRVQVNPLPAAPAITSLRPVTFCDRDFTVLQASPSNSYQWSNGSNQREVEVRTSGEFSLTTIDRNGCRSPVSQVVRVTANPLPPTPTITASGPLTFCSSEKITLKSTEAKGYVWNSGSTNQEFSTNLTGIYQVRTKNEFNCLSDASNTISLNALPLPAAPTVTALGRTTFCQGEEVQLTTNTEGDFSWNTGATGKSIIATESGNYSARVQGTNGCFSPFSQALRLESKPKPPLPVVQQVGTYTLEAGVRVPNEDFLWQRDGVILGDSTSLIKATKPGAYLVKAAITYSPTLVCFSDESAIFNFIPEADGNGISIYPNPTDNGMIIAETRDNLEGATVRVYDLKGVPVQTFLIDSFEQRQFLDLSNLSSGMYILKISSGFFHATQKLMISK
ncbi:T9SS type A sorting domain-containing protein [Persicitalea sp.]|uniref:T9SS type A sorting domain-containing protein n=1 Tax=Persicitalea sp. TaxID=3100273 RepID=UPI0035946236